MLLYPISPLLQQELQQLFVFPKLPLNLASLCLTIPVSPTTASVLPVGVYLCVCERDIFLMMQAIWNGSQSPVFKCCRSLDYKWTEYALSKIICRQGKKSHGWSTGKEQTGKKHVFFNSSSKSHCLLFFSPFFSLYEGFRRNEEMRAMEVLPILKEKVAFLSGKIMCLNVSVCVCLASQVCQPRLSDHSRWG